MRLLADAAGFAQRQCLREQALRQVARDQILPRRGKAQQHLDLRFWIVRVARQHQRRAEQRGGFRFLVGQKSSWPSAVDRFELRRTVARDARRRDQAVLLCDIGAQAFRVRRHVPPEKGPARIVRHERYFCAAFQLASAVSIVSTCLA